MKRLLLAITFIAVSCTNSQIPELPPPPPPVEQPPPPPPPPPPPTSLGSLKWEENHKERMSWSAELISQIKANITSFDKGADAKDFCPKYKSLDTEHRIFTIATMAVAIALYESSYNSNSIFHEPPPLNTDSVGLFQLSYEDKFAWCTMDRTSKSLQNPLINIECAIPKMAKLIASDGYISGGGSNAWRGLTRYWSVTRPAGKKAQIVAAVKTLSFCN